MTNTIYLIAEHPLAARIMAVQVWKRNNGQPYCNWRDAIKAQDEQPAMMRKRYKAFRVEMNSVGCVREIEQISKQDA